MMPSVSDWKVAESAQPKREDYGYDLEAALASMVSIRSVIPGDAFTAQTLGTERAGHGVLIGKGLVLTIGYLITEAERIWLTLSDGSIVEGHALAHDYDTGFGLIQILAKVDMPHLSIGQSRNAKIDDHVVMGAGGGRHRSVAAKVAGRQEFAGYWEYVLDDAIFTAPSHPNWGGTAMIGAKGELLGIGSLQLERSRQGAQAEPINMIVPIDILKPALDDLVKFGRANRPVRPWLGLYSTEMDDHIVVAGVAKRGPARRAELKIGDVVLAVAGKEVDDLADFYRKIWSLGTAGVNVPLTIHREGDTFDVTIKSGERAQFLRQPSMH